MADVYSTRLAEGQAGSAGSADIYTAPASGTVVIRDVLAIVAAGATTWYISDTDGGIIFLWEGAASSLDQFFHVSCRAVMKPGNKLTYHFTGAGGRWWISGYVLD